MPYINTEWRNQNARIKWIISGLNWDNLSEFDKKFVKEDTLTD